MSTAAATLVHALALPPGKRAGIAHSLLQSLPDGPPIYETRAELARRKQSLENGNMETFDADETLRRAEEALIRIR